MWPQTRYLGHRRVQTGAFLRTAPAQASHGACAEVVFSLTLTLHPATVRESPTAGLSAEPPPPVGFLLSGIALGPHTPSPYQRGFFSPSLWT